MDNDNKNQINYDNIPWSIIETYFKNKYLNRLVKHQLESYNYFVDTQIKKTIEMFNPVHICSEHDYIKEHKLYRLEIFITLSNFSIHRPQVYENNGASKLMFPQEARIRNFTYAGSMTVDLNIKYIVRNGTNYENVIQYNKLLPKIHIGKLPIMLKSNICILNQYTHLNHNLTQECRMDPGGYFIINGSEKTCLGQERAAENQIYCFNIQKNNTKWCWSAEMKSIPDWKCISPKQISLLISSKSNTFGKCIYLQIPRLKNPIPLFIIFRAFNIISDKDICEKIIIDINSKNNKKLLYALKGSILDANKCLTYNDAIKYIISNVIYTPLNVDKETGSKKKYDFALEVINNDIFPHCKTLEQKIYMLGYMTNTLLETSFGNKPTSDRDSYLNKRIDLTGVLLNNLLRNYLNKLVKDMQKQVIREINNGSWKSNENYENIINNTNIYKIIKSTTIENGIKRALATGDFGIKQVNTNKVGVAQVLNRLTYISSISHLRRISTPIDKSGKLVPPRKLHNTSWGFLCPAETPEGGSVGIVKNLAALTHITIPSESSGIYSYLENKIITFDKIDAKKKSEYVKIFINGCWIGFVDNPIEVFNDLKNKKYLGIINIYTSIIFDYQLKEIKICNDGGRLTRPVFKIKNNKFIDDFINNKNFINKLNNNEYNWEDLLYNGKIDNSIIEYIDSYEQNNSMIAMNMQKIFEINNTKYNNNNNNSNNIIYKYTHCEIHPSTIFGILASCIPFPENNQAPRNTYQSAMGKQAIGMYVTNYDKRMDKTAYILSYPMRPLVETRLMNIIRLDKIPSGEQVIVAIASHTGYNQEDSILFNKGSIDRGLFLATIYHTEKDEDKNLYGNEEIRCKPDTKKTKNLKFANYNKINKNGIIPENTLVEDKDIIISKVLPIKENKNDFTKDIKYTDDSTIYRTNEETYIDKNIIDTNGDGYNFCKVRLRAMRKPNIGDKFSSRHGQKGTIGNIIPEQDMPFTADGLKPDIIINPHAIPSRMTIAQLKETLLGKVLLQLGLFGDGTSFGDLKIEDIAKKLQNVGYESNGNEILYNGLTGEQLTCSIFIGPAFYQRLKHMVNDKQHSRSIGPMVNLTRQPAEGRARDGGLRFGEMERDCMVSHGASRFTKGRIYDASDAYGLYICGKCGLTASFNNVDHIHICNNCENRTDFKYVEIPYSCKLLFQELLTMNIAPRIITE
jgi:DNA-directed RNA polymerase II subunit RPB2